jgi:hypothetical protein
MPYFIKSQGRTQGGGLPGCSLPQTPKTEI